MRSLQRSALLGLAAVLATGCAQMGSYVPDSMKNGDLADKFKNPAVCAAAGALLAGGVGAVENKEAMAIGAVAGGLLGWWACNQQEKPLPDADGDGVPDKIDMCANTPAGTKVIDTGCPVDADTDMDGVADSADKCAATPRGATVDSTGCVPTADADGDGVTDMNDLCQNTPAGSIVLPNGCEMDSDGDGVPDSRDRCAGTPTGIKVAGDGCAVDSDGDGVSDILDRCPTTPSGAKVDSAGCEAAVKPEAPMSKNDTAKSAAAPAAKDMVKVPTEAGQSIVLKGVVFESSSAKLTRDSLATLNDVAEQLKQSGAKVEVSGHTDASGSPTVNRALSQRRAEVVMTYLASKGVPAENMTAKGYGPDAPVADNANAGGRAKNRRVELKVMGGN